MTWTITNLVVQIITGIVGGHLAASLAKEHSFGVLGHTIAGAVAGALSGYFLQSLVGTVVNGGGDLNDVNPVEQAVLQGIAGVTAGAIATLAIGFLKHSIDQHKSAKTP